MAHLKKIQNLPGKSIKLVSLFTGAGGLDLGFEQAGFETVYATDFDTACCETLKKNIGKHFPSKMKIVESDIRKLDFKTLPQKADLVIGGPPCQTFSASGRRAGGARGRLDERGTLFEAYLKVIKHLKPKAFLFENVRGILGTNEGKDWEAIVSSFEGLGYQIQYRILDALDYGAPQQRERMIMVGHKNRKAFLFPEPLFGPDSATNRKHISAGAALKGLKNTEPLEPLYLKDGKYAHLLKLVPPGDNYLFFTAKRGYPTPIFAYRSRFSDFLYKANPAFPIKTLIASPGKYTGPFHWENRSFTVAEYARLQGFPDDFVFTGSRKDAVKQIGNSVSPKFARCLALAIAKQIFSKKVDMHLLPENRILSFDKRKGQKAQNTRLHHKKVQSAPQKTSKVFTPNTYMTHISPSSLKGPNATVIANEGHAKIVLHTDESNKPFAEMIIKIMHDSKSETNTLLSIAAYGESEITIQTMWNAVDDWVIRASKFHSLFELYGHFTEPHPIFEVISFTAHTNHPIGRFAKHCVNFENCSRHFPREHLTDLFGLAFREKSFIRLVETLRGYRFDIRCHETNVTMPEDKYMVCYPFSLPFTKQMNFAVKKNQVEHDGLLEAAE